MITIDLRTPPGATTDGVSRSAAYGAAKAGQIPTIAFGRRLLVPTCRSLEMLGVPLEEQC